MDTQMELVRGMNGKKEGREGKREDVQMGNEVGS